MHRRDLLKTGISVTCAALLAPLAIPARAASHLDQRPATGSVIGELAGTLRTIGGEVCVQAARRLDALPGDATTFDLHLRQAGLSRPDADLLAVALRSSGTRGAPKLGSFSLSYNPGMGDEGASAIASALPTSLPELGMVGCGLGDRAGEALLRWARRAPELHTMCIEQNRFSGHLKARFNALGRQRSGFLMMV